MARELTAATAFGVWMPVPTACLVLDASNPVRTRKMIARMGACFLNNLARESAKVSLIKPFFRIG